MDFYRLSVQQNILHGYIFYFLDIECALFVSRLNIGKRELGQMERMAVSDIEELANLEVLEVADGDIAYR